MRRHPPPLTLHPQADVSLHAARAALRRLGYASSSFSAAAGSPRGESGVSGIGIFLEAGTSMSQLRRSSMEVQPAEVSGASSTSWLGRCRGGEGCGKRAPPLSSGQQVSSGSLGYVGVEDRAPRQTPSSPIRGRGRRGRRCSWGGVEEVPGSAPACIGGKRGGRSPDQRAHRSV
jgi:hypothetical protein